MPKSAKNRKKPKIVMSSSDHEHLTRLANNSLNTMPELAEELLNELDRAKVMKPASVPADIVKMGSVVHYESANGPKRRVILVNPGEADISQSKVSVMTPIGTALIGLAEGQSISWTNRDGQSQHLTIVTVEQPEAEAETP